ncbi:hypothetical protein vBVpP1_36 [Vibrio phage vB_VpP_1]|nr:hypothetical protein vBVpP1_36 [Vibrio phage vB_VpP_1]
MKKLLLSIAIAACSFSAFSAEKLNNADYSKIVKGIEVTTCLELGLKEDIDVAIAMLPLKNSRPDVFKALIQSDLSYVVSVMSNEQFLGLADVQDRVKANPRKYCK